MPNSSTNNNINNTNNTNNTNNINININTNTVNLNSIDSIYLNPTLQTKVNVLEEALTQIAKTIPQVALASSLSMEDQVLLDVIARLKLTIAVFTLNTGRLHAETLAVVVAVKAQYGLDLVLYTPVEQSVLQYVKTHGENAFYESIELRKQCCALRKVEPLRRALAGRGGWITGQRREQSQTRTALPAQEFDGVHQQLKFNPLADWSFEDVQLYVKAYSVPINALHARGYPSIGCEPCTRAIKAGEDERAGRWWWENANTKECGLHVKPS